MMRRGHVLRLVVSLAMLVGVVWIVDAPAALDRLRGMQMRWIAVAVLCFTMVTVLMAWRWQITARRLGASFGLGWAVREYYLSQLVNLCLPGGVLGDAGRALRTPQGAGGLTPAAHAVMIERLIGQMAVIAVGGCGVVLASMPGGIDWPVWASRALIWGLAAMGAVAGIAVLIGMRARPLRRFGGSLRRAFLTRGVVMGQLILSVVIALLMIGAFVACARATGTVMPIEAALTLVPLILTAMMLPVSIGGWGLREGAAAALFPMMGVAANAGVAAGAAYGLALTVACLPGLALIPLRVRHRSG